MIEGESTAALQVIRIALAAAWIVVAGVTFRAIGEMGVATAGDIFFADLAHPWRAQFNLDFLSHLLLVALWLGWTDKRAWLGPVVGLLAILGGGVFTFAYLIVRSFDGNSVDRLLLGRQYRKGMFA